MYVCMGTYFLEIHVPTYSYVAHKWYCQPSMILGVPSLLTRAIIMKMNTQTERERKVCYTIIE